MTAGYHFGGDPRMESDTSRRRRGRWMALLGAVLLSSCALLANSFSYQPSSPKVLKSDVFAVTVEDAQTDMGVKDFIFDVTVENITSSEQVFDSGDLEVRDVASGISYFSISKGKEAVTLPVANVITRTTLKAGQKTAGRLWFPTPPVKANGEKIELLMGKVSQVFERRAGCR